MILNESQSFVALRYFCVVCLEIGRHHFVFVHFVGLPVVWFKPMSVVICDRKNSSKVEKKGIKDRPA